MSQLDWLVMLGVLGFIALYGFWKTRHQNSLNSFILGNQENAWWKVGLTVMATQASAITFISTTGQGFSDGLQFVQFYFGLPLAMIVICISFIPRFYKMGVFTAYEYLETRFDLKTRLLAAFIFLIQRGLAAGITLYAPSIILSTIFGWDLQWTHIFSGLAVILYTVTGGAEAVTKTQLQQMLVIFVGMFFVFFYMLASMPDSIGFAEVVEYSAWMGKMEAVNFQFQLDSRYNFWAGITGGFFLALAYFGTDQSQVQRYLAGKNIQESRMGLILNGILKVPMQVFILFCGVTLFVLYLFMKPPIHFNDKIEQQLKTNHSNQWNAWNARADSLYISETALALYVKEGNLPNELLKIKQDRSQLKEEVNSFVKENLPSQESNDRDYVFIHYIIHHLPKGFIGLMIAVILCAAMSSISAELNALAGTSTIDFVKRITPTLYSQKSEQFWSRCLTACWGLVAICFALYATLFENLIQFINIVGSLFYGTVLGIFMSAFYVKRISGTSVFYAALAAQSSTLMLFFFSDLGFLWYNVISCFIVVFLGSILEALRKKPELDLQ